jgi:putative Mg2+ transporter-C (MgtC) family protein
MASLDWYEIVGRLMLAAVLGGALGVERESGGHDAGLRTHLLLALGSALFAVVSVGGFDEFVGPRASTNVAVDVTRVAAYVAPGVGFLGAGVIVKQARGRSSWVRGLTTAASLWTAAAVGVATGVGFWIGAVTATAVALVALAAVHPLSTSLQRRSGRAPSAIAEIHLAEAEVDAAMSRLGQQGTLGSVRVERPAGSMARIHAEIELVDLADAGRVAQNLSALSGVELVSVEVLRPPD